MRTLFFKLLLCFVYCSFANADFNQDTIPVTYELIDRKAFGTVVVGNTVVGITRQSHSLYMVYFAPEGHCTLWKQDQVYKGTWWIEKDTRERDFVRAIWPEYTSSHAQSLFSKEHPHYGKATSVWYYTDTTVPGTLYVANKRFRAPVILVPGKAFPQLKE